MAQNFPSNPIVGNSYTVNNESWTYDGSGWSRAVTATGSGILPPVADNSGRYLTTDGSTISWGTVAAAVPKITGISVTDNIYTVLDDTAVGTAGGYIKITGTGFTAGSQVLIGTVAASSVSFVGSTELRAQVPATVAGTYVVYVVATDGAVAIRVNGITFSSTPTWSTSSSLGTSGAAVSIQLAAVSDTAITYSLAAGSTLPSGLSLSSSGLLSGTVTGVTVDITYNFTINAVDLENQDSPRTFSITITVKDPYFPYVPLLLETGSTLSLNTTVTDSSASPNTVTRVSNPSTGWVSPYQTDGYWGNQFNGNTDYLTISSTPITTTTSTFTVEAWIHPKVSSSSFSIIGDQNSAGSQVNWSFGVSSSNLLTLYWWNGSTNFATGNTTIKSNEWAHVALVINSNAISMYVNGVQQTISGPTTFSNRVSTLSSLLIGQLSGYISNLRLVNGIAVYTSAFTPPTTPLQKTQSSGINISAITGSQTSLLTCQSNRFIDNSNGAIAITVNGTPQVTPYFYPSGFTAPAASPGAALFNGSSQYLSLTPTSAFNFSTNNWTIEMWVNLNTVSVQQVPICFGYENQSQRSFVLYLTSSNVFQFAFSTNGSNNTDTSLGASGITVGTWNHLAIVRNGATITVYRNGVAYGTTISIGASPINYSPGAFRIAVDSTNYLNGYIGNLRIVNGTAVYTGAFTPPSGALTQTGGTYPSTTNVVTGFTAANTSLLLNLADSNYNSATDGVQNNTFIDTGPYAFPITRNGTATQGSVTPYWPDGQWSNYFDGDADFLNNGPTNSTILDSIVNVTTGQDGTFECWVYPIALTTASPLKFSSAVFVKGNIYAGLFIDATGAVTWYMSGGAEYYLTTAAGLAFTNTWQHIALVWTNNNVKIYINGVQRASGTRYTVGLTNQYFSIGRGSIGSATGYWNGYISNMRVVNEAIYLTNFTPPTSPLTRIPNTSLLTCQSNRFIDNSTNNYTFAINGTPRVQAFQPFSPTAAYTAALYGGSGYFNGSTDYLTRSFTSRTDGMYPQGTTYTLEAWIYLLSNSTKHSLYLVCETFQDGFANLEFCVTSSTRILTFGVRPSTYSASAIITGNALSLNTWHHVAVSVSSGSGKLFVNGTQAGSTTTIPALAFNPVGAAIGIWPNGYNDPTSPRVNGYISNLRLVQGIAVYTADFTPPTTPLTAIANTGLLLNFTNAAIYDASTQNNVTTVGDAQASSAITAKWPPTSMKFDGTGDSLTIPANSIFAWGTGDFTVELWANNSAAFTASRNNIAGTMASGGGLFAPTNTSMNWNSFGVGDIVTVAYVPTIGQWYHLAYSRSSGTGRLFINGILVASASDSTNYTSTSFTVGGISTQYFNGYIQDLRVTRGVARYTATFTPPTLAFQTR
jgi:hypothetical protein